MDAAQASPVSVWMAVSREQNDHPLVPHTARLGGRLRSERRRDNPETAFRRVSRAEGRLRS
jgi:hypothetical protein